LAEIPIATPLTEQPVIKNAADAMLIKSAVILFTELTISILFIVGEIFTVTLIEYRFHD
jgi:hypothetical protein